MYAGYSYALCVALTMWTAMECAHAQSIRSDSVHHLSEIVVKAQRESSAHQVIDYSQLQSLPSSSVADALKYMAGVQIKDYGGLGGQKTINVRSLGSQHVGVYLDGVRITNAQNGTVDLGKYSLTTLESVSLFNANKAEMLMTASEYASASTVYLRTRRPDSTSVQASYSCSSFKTHKAGATFAYKNWLLLDAAYTSSGGEYPFEYHTEYEDTSGTRRNSDISMMRFEGNVFWKGLQWHTYYFDSERGLPGGIVRRLSDTYTDVGREWDRNFFSQLTWRQAYGNFQVRAIGKYTNDYLHYRSDYPENISVHSNNKYHQQDIYGAGALAYEHGRWQGSLSTDLRWSDLTCNVKQFHYVYRLDSKTSLSAFYRHRGLHLTASGLYTHVTDHTYWAAKPLSRATWNVLASYTLGKWQMRTFYKSVFRVPTLNDLYYTLVGNRNLKPEYTKQLDLGVTYEDHIFNIQLDAYYNRIEDKIVAIPMKCQFRWSMVNFGLVKSLGLSATAGYDRTWGKFSASASANYTCQRDRDYSSPHAPEYRNTIPYSPLHSASIIVDLGYEGWSLCTSWLYTGERFALISNNRDDLLGAWQTVDLKLNKRFRIRRHSLQATLECNNLGDSRHEVVKRYPMPGRNWKEIGRASCRERV